MLRFKYFDTTNKRVDANKIYQNELPVLEFGEEVPVRDS